MNEFEMTDLGLMHYFLRHDEIFISQKKYLGEILDTFKMKDSNPVNALMEVGLKLNTDCNGIKVINTQQKIVGSLMYLTRTRSDIMIVILNMNNIIIFQGTAQC